MKRIIIMLILSGVVFSNSQVSNNQIIDKKQCYQLLYKKNFDITVRSKNGWIRYFERTIQNQTEKKEYIDCIEFFYNDNTEVRIGDTL